MNDWFGLLIAFVYIFAIIGVAEGLRRWRGYGTSFTRKFIHIGVGMLSWLVPLLFSSPWPFVFACGVFVVLNLLDLRYGFFSSMATGDTTNLGTVYFPIAAAAVALVFWERPPLMVAALMPLTWGDGLASVIGRAHGRNKYAVFGHTRSLEGSATFLVTGAIFTWLALWVVSGSPQLSASEALPPAVVTVLVTTAIEAVSIWGLDNLSVTAAATIILAVWPF